MIKNALKSTLLFSIPIVIIQIISSFLKFEGNRRLWNQIAPHGEEAFWESISPEVIDSVFPDGVLPRMRVWNDYLAGIIIVSLITYAAVFLICLLKEWLKNRQPKQEA